MSVQHDTTSSARSGAHPPELPRVYLDTRMPAAPAPGGRIIRVGPPATRPRRADVTFGAVALTALLVVAAAFRWARHRGPG